MHMATIFFTAHFCADTIRGQCLFLWKACRHPLWLSKVHTSDTVMIVSSLSSAVSRANKSNSTNSPSASLGWWLSSKIICVCVHVLCIVAAATIQGRHLFCSELPIVRLLFEGSDYLRVTSIWKSTVSFSSEHVHTQNHYSPCCCPGFQCLHVL